MKSTIKQYLQNLNLVTFFLLFSVSANAIVPICLDVFPTVLSSTTIDGKTELKVDIDLFGTNGTLDIEIEKDETIESNPSCISQKCIDSTNRAEAFILPELPESTSDQDFKINEDTTLFLSQGSYDKIEIKKQGTVHFTNANQDSFIKTLKSDDTGKADDDTDTNFIFEQGVYWIEDFNIGQRTNIIINGNDKVTLIVKKADLNEEDIKINVNGTPDQLVIIAYDDVKLGKRSQFNGFIYSEKKVEVEEDSILEGAINADEIKLAERVAMTYAPYSINTANYNGFCSTLDLSAYEIAEYRFEETLWNGTAGEIIDSSGNGHHAHVNNNSTPNSSLPALSGNPGTCGYANQNDGSIQVTGLPLDATTNGVKTTVTFWMNWDGTDRVMPIGWNYHNIWIYQGSIGFNTGQGDQYGISSDGLANGWHHIAVEFTNGNVTNNRIHIDGVDQVLTQRRNTPNNSQAFVSSELRIGGWAINSNFDFHGLIDEVRVYNKPLTTNEIATIMAETHTCALPAIDHFEIVHDDQGLTCESEAVIIKACADESCSSLATEPVNVDFLAVGALTKTINITFTGSTTVNFNHTDIETLTFSIANSSVTPSGPLVCDDSSGNSCDMAFSDSGFRFIYGNSTTIPNQTAGTEFGDTLKIQAVQGDNGVCTGIFSGNKNIEMSQENINPGGITGLSFSISGNDIVKHPNSISPPPSTTLNFGADSTAIIPSPLYNDAGRIRLHANYNSGGITLLGSSNAFWVSPAALVVTATSGATDLNGASATANITHKAGEDFELTVAAYNAATPAVITPNYNPGQLQLMLSRIGPTLMGSSDASLNYAQGSVAISSTNPIFQNITLTNFAFGISTFTAAQYSEVGLLNLALQDINYGNLGIIVPAEDINIGRFIPDHFKQTIADDGYFFATCNTGTTFAYNGQKDQASDSIGAISYLTNPVFAITAYNKQGDITQNYYEDSQDSENDYMKLSVAGINITEPTADQVAVGVDGNPLNKLSLTANMHTGTLSQNDLTTLVPANNPLPKGVLHYQLSDSDNFFYNRSANALVAPFTADIDLSIASIIDTDAVNVTTTIAASPTGVDIRFGRWVLNNSFGSETSNLSQPMQIEHFDGTAFVVTSNNNCVTYDASKVSLTNISLDPTLSSVVGGTGNIIAGKTQALELEATGSGNQGQIGVSYDSYNWLKFDWDNNGLHDNNPNATATFGVYRGNDRIISWREVYN
jgi:MSHA biogenesis protein MshQ